MARTTTRASCVVTVWRHASALPATWAQVEALVARHVLLESTNVKRPTPTVKTAKLADIADVKMWAAKSCVVQMGKQRTKSVKRAQEARTFLSEHVYMPTN